MIRLGLIGNGRWGKNYVAAAKLAGNCEVAHISGPREYVDIDLEKMAYNWDAIIIATPPEATAQLAYKALHDYTKPVMIEKPVGLSVEAAQIVQDAESGCGKVVLVNHQHLFAPAYEELHRRVKDLPHFQIATQGGDQKPAHDWPWLWDWAPHDVAMVLDLGGTDEPELAHAWFDKDSVFARWRTQRGSAFSHIGVNFGHKQRRLRVSDHGFHLVYDDRAEHKLTIDNRPIEVSPELPLTRSLRAFAEAVKNGGTEDRRFGARWGVTVAKQIAAMETFACGPENR